MSTPEEKLKHSQRIRRKKKAKVRSSIAKELLMNHRYRQRIVVDKRGNKHDLRKMDHLAFVEAIQKINSNE